MVDMDSEIVPSVRAYNQKDDVLVGINEPLERSSLLDFWSWAFSDLCDDDIKGIFAEWMVLKLLGIPSTRRVSWANSDLITKSEVGIEVKSTSYWQSWKLIDGFGKVREIPSHPLPPDAKIAFHGLMARDSTDVSVSSDKQTFKSKLYVFAFQHEKDWHRWNAMDLSQWEFYLVPSRKLKYGSISLPSLQSLNKGPYTAVEFQEKATEAIQAISKRQTEETTS